MTYDVHPLNLCMILIVEPFRLPPSPACYGPCPCTHSLTNSDAPNRSLSVQMPANATNATFITFFAIEPFFFVCSTYSSHLCSTLVCVGVLEKGENVKNEVFLALLLSHEQQSV